MDVDGVAETIHVPVQTAIPQRALAVRTVEPHQHRVVHPIPVTQQVPPRPLLSHLSVEPQHRLQLSLSPRAVRAVRRLTHLARRLLSRHATRPPPPHRTGSVSRPPHAGSPAAGTRPTPGAPPPVYLATTPPPDDRCRHSGSAAALPPHPSPSAAAPDRHTPDDVRTHRWSCCRRCRSRTSSRSPPPRGASPADPPAASTAGGCTSGLPAGQHPSRHR